jgi:hypothetical protein
LEVFDQAHQQSEDCGRSQARLNTNKLRYVCLEVRDEAPESLEGSLTIWQHTVLGRPHRL